MKIAVIIVTYNAVKWIDKCIKPLTDVTEDRKVYIIDNGSTDGTQEIMKSNYPQFIFHETNQNLGFGKANNLGLKMALEDGADYFFLLNQDAYLSWDNIIKLALIQSQNQEYGVLSPIQMYDENTLDYMHYLHLHNSKNSFLNDLIAENQFKKIYEIDFANAAIWMLSKECLKNTGGFEPLFFHYGEDDEYIQRVKYFKFKVGVCPDIKGFHYRKQNGIRDRNEPFFYKTYLTMLKDNKRNLFYQYLKIFLKISLSFFRKANKVYKTSSIPSFKAFVKLCFKVNKVIESRNNNQEYRFINYQSKNII